MEAVEEGASSVERRGKLSETIKTEKTRESIKIWVYIQCFIMRRTASSIQLRIQNRTRMLQFRSNFLSFLGSQQK